MAPTPLTLDDLGASGRSVQVLHLDSVLAASGPTVPTCHLALFVTEGRAAAAHLTEVALSPGEVHLIPSGLPARLLDGGNLRGWLLAFDAVALGPYAPRHHQPGDGLDDLLPKRSLFVQGLLRLRPHPSRWVRLLQHLRTLHDELRQPQIGTASAAQALLVLILLELHRELMAHGPQAPVTANATVRAALAHIEAHYAQPLSVAKVAAAVRRSPSYLSHAVKGQTGLTVGEWIRAHRMAEARRLLSEGVAVDEVARASGYRDVTHFIRTFRTVHGQTPHAWRRVSPTAE